MTLPKLGCRPAIIRPGQPRLRSSLSMMARKAPERVIRTVDPSPQMLGNDKIGNCTAAGIINHMRATTALAGFEIISTEQDAIRFYEQSTGYNPANPATDQGGVETDVLTYASRHGIQTESGTFYPVWGTADAGDWNGCRNIISDMGAAYFGVELAVADQETGGVWDTTTPGDQTPGSWGGHCLLGWDYDGTADTDIVTLLTWGAKQKCTWRWLKSRVTEMHGLLWRQLLRREKGTSSLDQWGNLIAENKDYLAGEVA